MKVIWLILIIVISGCVNSVNINECEKDSDCVKAGCCHAKSCVVKEEAPNCEGMFCTENCEPGSLDCGQGSCGCVNNKCEAVMK